MKPMVAASRSSGPDREFENALYGEGHRFVVGVDEVGKGAWAGPLCVGMAVIAREPTLDDPPGVRDSKAISEKKREAMFDTVAAWCTAWSVGCATHAECDDLGMAKAQRLATQRALDTLSTSLGGVPDAAVVDGSWDFVSPMIDRVDMRVKGDTKSLSIAAASILAKVSRDRLMRAVASDYPMWNFESNKGYPCHWHRSALQAYGPSAIHRRSWAFMDSFVPWPGVVRRSRVDDDARQISLFG